MPGERWSRMLSSCAKRELKACGIGCGLRAAGLSLHEIISAASAEPSGLGLHEIVSDAGVEPSGLGLHEIEAPFGSRQILGAMNVEEFFKGNLKANLSVVCKDVFPGGHEQTNLGIRFWHELNH